MKPQEDVYVDVFQAGKSKCLLFQELGKCWIWGSWIFILYFVYSWIILFQFPKVVIAQKK